ncbi:MAG: hypothetical protein Kow0062_11320 [Acidobacteriota bacterium]
MRLATNTNASLRFAACAALALLTPGLAPASLSPDALVGPAPDSALAVLDAGFDRLGRALGASFGLELGAGPAAVPRAGARVHEARLAGPLYPYLQIALAPRRQATRGVLPSPTGLLVLEADLYFAEETRLTEASLLVLAEAGRRDGLLALEREFGRPAFRARLPGDGDLVVGWRAGRALALARVTDLDVIHLTLSLDDPDDAVAGPTTLLFEGLETYARRRETQGATAELEIEVRRLLDWVELARSAVRAR